MAKHWSSRRGRRRQTLAVPFVLAAAAIVALGALIYEAARPQPGRAVPDLGHQHILPPGTIDFYNSTPPTSGPHYGSLAPWGIHTTPIQNELQVHNLEDGGVMVQYNCPEGCPDVVDQLTAIVSRYDQQVILAPYPGMDVKIALTAWGRIETLDTIDETKVVRFIEAYHGIDHHTG